MNELKLKRQYLRDQNRLYGPTLVEIPCKGRLHDALPDKAPRRAWRSRDFLVQLFFEERTGIKRLSINRTEINREGGWKDGITWDELQRLKREAGFGDVQAIEFYPADSEIVYDANIRHLFLMEAPLLFAWTRENATNAFSLASPTSFPHTSPR